MAIAPPASASAAVPRGGRLRGVLTGFALALAPALVIALAFGLMLAVATDLQRATLTADREAQMRASAQVLRAALEQSERFALAHAEAQARRPEVQRALGAGDRPGLLAMTAPVFEHLAAQDGVRLFSFQTADMIAFLRVHRPDGFGDDQSRTRPMVLAANRGRRGLAGLEIGSTGILGLRGIAPVMQGAVFRGTVEIGLEVQPIIEQVKTVTNADVAVILSRSLTDLPATDPTGRSTGEVFGDQVLHASTSALRFADLLRAGLITGSRGRDVIDLPKAGPGAMAAIEPLTDFSGRMIGHVVLVEAFPDHVARSRRTSTDLWAVALIGGCLAFAVFSALGAARAGRSREARP
jgi:hypothetical protein